MDWKKYITVNQDICHGKACIKGTRIMVSIILDNIANNITTEEILKSYPTIDKISIRACVAYAAALANDRVINF